METQTLDKLNQSQLETTNTDLTLKMSLTTLREKLNNAQDLANIRHYNTTIAHTSLSLNIVLITIFICSIVIVIYVYRVCRKYQQKKRQIKDIKKNSVKAENSKHQPDEINTQAVM